MSTVPPAEIKQGIRQTFDLVASGYDTPAMRYFPSSADHLASDLGPRQGDKVLDIATGTGMAAMAIAKRVGPEGRVQAIDLSERMLDMAARNILQAGLTNIDLHIMDAEHLEFNSSSFDAASCAFGLFFLPDMSQGAREIFRVLKPGGRFMYTTFASQAFAPLAERFLARLAEHGINLPDNTGGQRLSDEEACLSLLHAASFEDTRLERRQLGYHLDGPLDWWEILYNSGFRGLLEQLEPDQQTAFRQTHLAEIESLKTAQGIWLDVEVMFVSGQRPH